MFNRFFRLIGCIGDHALECDTVTSNLIPTKRKDLIIDCSSPTDRTKEAPKDNTNIIQFVTSLNQSGYVVKKPRSKPISPSRSILKCSTPMQPEPGTPVPKIIFEEDDDSYGEEDFLPCERVEMSSPVQTIKWGHPQYFPFNDTEEDESLSPEVTGTSIAPRP